MKELPLALRSINCLRPRVAIKNRGVEWRGVFSLEDINLFQAATEDRPDLVLHRGNEDVWMHEYLNEELPSFYTSNLSAIEGTSFSLCCGSSKVDGA